MTTPVVGSPSVVPATGVPAVGDPAFSTQTRWNGTGSADSPIGAYADKVTADPDRLQTRTRVDARGNLRDLFGWFRKKDADRAARESVTETDADGWQTRKGGSGRGVAERPANPGESRPTQSMGPSTYSFSRPFDATMERQLSGMHFSMADHRRTYEIFGMAAPVRARNTYRIEPGPTDRDITEMPEDVSYAPQYAQAPAVSVGSVERGWRL